MLTSGVSMAERYRLDDRIAAGGMGEVWRGEDTVLGRTVAIKVLKTEHVEDADFRERLRREARAAGSISHPNVVSVFDFGEQAQDNGPDLSYIVMECVDGPSLAQVLAEDPTLSPSRTLEIIEQTAMALDAAHTAGIIHRDIKPGNILITPDHGVKIADFGIARASDAASLTRTGTLTGTAQYISPEQARGGQATAASDLYSLGIVAYRCLSGEVPFAEGNEVTIAVAHLNQEPRDLPETVPFELRQLVTDMLSKDPAARPPSAAAVAMTAAAARALLSGDRSSSDPGATATMAAAPVAASAGAVGTGEATTSTAGAETPTDGFPVPANAGESEEQKPRRRRYLAAGLIAVLLLLAGGGWAMLGGSELAMPSVVGQQIEDAERVLAEDGLEATVEEADVAGKDAGVVVEQTPDAESAVEASDRITLTVATGRVGVPVDDLIGKPYDDAAQVLEELGLEPVRVDEVTSESSDGTVIAVLPDSTVDNGAKVQLTVATAPAPPTPAPTPTPTPTPSPSPEPQDDDQEQDDSGDEGNGNGRGGDDKKEDKSDDKSDEETEKPTDEPKGPAEPSDDSRDERD